MSRMAQSAWRLWAAVTAESDRSYPGAPELPAQPDPHRSESWGWCLAQIISQAFSPPVLGAGALVVAGAREGTRSAVWWTAAYMAVAVLVPMLFILRLFRRGRVTGLDIQLREQRAVPMIFTLSAMGVAVALLWLGGAPRSLVVLALVNVALSVVLLLVTLRWKISVHSAVAGAVGLGAWYLLRTPLPLVLGVPTVSWARWRLKRHTWMQTVVGSAVGIAMSFVAWYVAGRPA